MPNSRAEKTKELERAEYIAEAVCFLHDTVSIFLRREKISSAKSSMSSGMIMGILFFHFKN